MTNSTDTCRLRHLDFRLQNRESRGGRDAGASRCLLNLLVQRLKLHFRADLLRAPHELAGLMELERRPASTPVSGLQPVNIYMCYNQHTCTQSKDSLHLFSSLKNTTKYQLHNEILCNVQYAILQEYTAFSQQIYKCWRPKKFLSPSLNFTK